MQTLRQREREAERVKPNLLRIRGCVRECIPRNTPEPTRTKCDSKNAIRCDSTALPPSCVFALLSVCVCACVCMCVCMCVCVCVYVCRCVCVLLLCEHTHVCL